MAPIGFCPAASGVGECRKSGPTMGEGDHPPCTSEARKGGETPMIAKRGSAASKTVQPLREGAGTGPRT